LSCPARQARPLHSKRGREGSFPRTWFEWLPAVADKSRVYPRRGWLTVHFEGGPFQHFGLAGQLTARLSIPGLQHGGDGGESSGLYTVSVSTNNSSLSSGQTEGKQVWYDLSLSASQPPTAPPRSVFPFSAQMPVSLWVSAGCSSMCAVLFSKRLTALGQVSCERGKGKLSTAISVIR
jgi:hypothetical protein